MTKGLRDSGIEGLRVGLPFVAVVGIVAGALAQVPAETAEKPITLAASDRTTLERLSLGRARAAAQADVWALRLAERWTIGQWAGQSLAVDRALRSWLRSQPRVGNARCYSDGLCESDVRVTPADLRDQIIVLLHGADPAEGVDEDVVRRAAADWPVTWRTGAAAYVERQTEHKPLGWEDVTFDGIALAKRAAAADAARALMSAAAKLRVSNARLLGEFLDSSDAVRGAVLAAIDKAAKTTVRAEPDQVAVAEATVTIAELIRILTDVAAAHYRGELFAAADFREIALLARQADVRGVGLAAAPPAQVVKSPYRDIELDAPEWASQTMEAVGRYEPQEGGALDEAARVEYARLDGMDGLRRKIEALSIRKDLTVSQFLGRHTNLKDDAVLFLTGARVVKQSPAIVATGLDEPAGVDEAGIVGDAPPAAPKRGAATQPATAAMEVEVELPLRRLWEIVRRGIRVIEVEPGEAGAAEPGDRPATDSGSEPAASRPARNGG